MNITTVTVSTLLFTAAVGIGEALSSFADQFTERPVFLTVEYLEMRDDGKVWQLVVPHGADVIRGTWTAQITRDGVWLCGGGGVAPYKGKPLGLTPSDWAGSPCPELRPGDKLYALWEWDAKGGGKRGITATYLVPDALDP